MQRSVYACSVASCIDRGPAFQSDFKVTVKHERQRLARASIAIQSNGKPVFEGVTAADGSVFVHGLSPGDYWIDVELLGISAASHCFHVVSSPSKGGRRRVNYEWGEWPTWVKSPSGLLLDSLPGSGASVLWNSINRVEIPIIGAAVTLINPFGEPASTITSDENGRFEFNGIGDGLYVLRIQGGKSNREFDVATFLLRVDAKARGSGLLMTKADAGGGSCSDISLTLSVR
jgi:hypothetical protein